MEWLGVHPQAKDEAPTATRLMYTPEVICIEFLDIVFSGQM